MNRRVILYLIPITLGAFGLAFMLITGYKDPVATSLFGFGLVAGLYRLMRFLIFKRTPRIISNEKFSITVPGQWMYAAPSSYTPKDKLDKMDKDFLTNHFTYVRGRNGIGPLQITIEPDGNYNPKNIIEGGLRNDYERKTAVINNYQKADYNISTVEFKSKDNELWKGMAICYKNKAAYLTYFCDKKDKNEQEWEEVDEIFNSFKFN